MKNNYYKLDETQCQQRAESVAAASALADVMRDEHRYSFTWMWLDVDGQRCLAKSTSPGVPVIRPGPGENLEDRFNQLTQDAASFHERKSKAQSAYDEAVVLNRRLGVGTAPSLFVSVLSSMHAYGVMEPYRVIGTHALYAYEAAALVAFDSSQTATQDIDLLWNYHRKIRFGVIPGEDSPSPTSMIEVLKKADPTFVRDEENKESAINGHGFAVDFLRVEETPKPALVDRKVMHLSDSDDDLLPVEALNANKFMQGAVFSEIVICATTGNMVFVPTVDPVIFAHFKQQMSNSESRDPRKRNRDKSQSDTVIDLLNCGLLKTRLSSEIVSFPIEGLNLA